MRFPLGLCFVVLAGLVEAGPKPAAFLDSHIIWERKFYAGPTSAVADKKGTLWIITAGSDPPRLVRIDATGRLLDMMVLPMSTAPQSPAQIAQYHEAVTPLGMVALLVDYSHGGQYQYFDGAKLGFFDADGKLGPLRRVTEPGPWNHALIPLSDEHFLVLGDQSPMRISRVSTDGDVIWRKDFSRNWVGPNGAPMENGSACILSGNYAANGLHLIRIDGAGIVRRRAEIDAKVGMSATGPGGVCAVLYGRRSDFYRVELSLVSFDPLFRRQWTVQVNRASRWGGQYHFLALSDGYLVCADTTDGLLIAKYNFAGQVLWSGLDSTRSSPRIALAFGDKFYFIHDFNLIQAK